MKRILLIIISCALLISFKKDRKPSPVQPVSKVLLKEVIAQHLPSPYFHFEYDGMGAATHVNFAANFFRYVLSYDNGRLTRMVNTNNSDTLLYVYTNNLVTQVKQVGGPGNQALWTYDCLYYANGLLKQVSWFRFGANAPAGVLERKVVLIYDGDGNLAEYDDYRNDPVIGLAWSSTVTYSQYDQQKNVDDFSVLKEFFDDLIYLPGITLQKNNPGKVLIKGKVNDFELTNSYQYNSRQLPVTKSTTMKQTRGTGTGQQNVFTTQYTYYQ